MEVILGNSENPSNFRWMGYTSEGNVTSISTKQYLNSLILLLVSHSSSLVAHPQPSSLLHLHKSPSTKKHPQKSPKNALPRPPRPPPNHPRSPQRPLHRQLQSPTRSRFLAGRRNLHPYLDLHRSRRRLRHRLVSRRSRGHQVLLREYV